MTRKKKDVWLVTRIPELEVSGPKLTREDAEKLAAALGLGMTAEKLMAAQAMKENR